MGVFDNNTTTTGSPWESLVPGTMQGVDYIRNLLSTGAYGGPYTAATDPRQTRGASIGSVAAGGAQQIGGAYGQQGSGLLPGIGQAFDYYGNAASGQSQNPWLTNQDDYMNLAGSFANNPYVDSMITASLRDPFRQFQEQTMPGISTGAQGIGMAGGSQEAIERGIATRGFADRAADVSAGVRGNFLQQGYDVANQAANADMTLQQNAANNLFQMGGQGLDWMSKGYDTQQKGAQDLFNWGSAQQGLENQQISGAIAQHMAPWELAQSYGSYMNPLAGALKTQSTDQNLLGAYLFQGLGPILGGIGSDIGDDAWDWIKGIWEQTPWGGGSSGGTCHIAREVFGPANFEWVLFFVWKEKRAPKWFSRLYDRHSRGVARWLKGKTRTKTLLRKLMRKAYQS